MPQDNGDLSPTTFPSHQFTERRRAFEMCLEMLCCTQEVRKAQAWHTFEGLVSAPDGAFIWVQLERQLPICTCHKAFSSSHSQPSNTFESAQQVGACSGHKVEVAHMLQWWAGHCQQEMHMKAQLGHGCSHMQRLQRGDSPSTFHHTAQQKGGQRRSAMTAHMRVLFRRHWRSARCPGSHSSRSRGGP